MAISKKKKFAAAGATATLALTGGIAFAYWTSTGTATGSGTTANEDTWDVSVSGVDNGVLAPTAVDGPVFDIVNFKFENNETGIKRAEDVTITADAAAPGCLDSDFAITEETYTTTDIAPGSFGTGSFKVRLVNSSINQDACKGTSVTYTVKVD